MLKKRGENSPNIRRIPSTLEHLRTYAQDMAYIEPPKQGEHLQTYKKRVYWMLGKMAEAGNPPRIMRIRHLHPCADWARIWENLHACWTTEVVKANWYRVIHDILPTNERLHKISLEAPPPPM